MLTIKIVGNDGTEWVKSEVKSVWFNPPTEQRGPSLFIWYKEQNAETIFSGKIYVMNENGKTVADYEMFGEPFKDVSLA